MSRSKQEIRAEILRTAENGAIKTRIVYGACLNFKMVKQHLAELINDGRLIQQGKKYFTTRSGLDYIQHVEAIA